MNPDERAHAVRRLSFLVAAVALWAAAIFFELVSMQIVHHQQFLARAHRQQERNIKVQPPRGDIFDRTGRPLAVSVPVDSVFVNPLRIPDKSIAAETIASILKVDAPKLQKDMEDAAKDDRGFLWVKRRISAEESRRLRDLKCDWIEFQQESIREYPDNGTGAHVIGGVYPKDEEGFAGVEEYFDDMLRGRPGTERDVVGVGKRILDSQTAKPAQPGESLTLTIDARIQYVAESEIKAAVEKHHARSGTVVVMNPTNGQVYAIANFPTYNPSAPPNPSGPEAHNMMDLGVQVPFEPGSIFKVMTLSAALETTNLTPDSPINCLGGILKLPGRVIHEAHGGYGILTMRQVLEKSSNIGAIQIGTRVGREKLYEYVRRFGFGATTGIPLPYESKGRLRKLDRWGTTSLASVSMGQEVSATSIQLARACSVIANGGLLVEPKLVLKRGSVMEPDDRARRIIKPETAMTMRSIMEGVVLRGTAKYTVKVPGYSVAGKTGTAQIFDFKTHHYTHSYNASFMGFTPIQNPALVIVVTLNGTSGTAGYGGAAAGPVFNEVAAEALRILEVPRDLPDDPGIETKPGKVDPEAADDVSIAGLDDKQPNILEDTDEPEVAQGGPRVPNFQGKTVREVMALATQRGIPVVVAGSGLVNDQMPLAGEVLLPGQKVRVTLAR